MAQSVSNFQLIYICIFLCPFKFKLPLTYLCHVIGLKHCVFLGFSSEGRRHDAGILADSNLLHSLEQYAYNTRGDPVCLYGDPAYPIRVHLQVPFRQNGLTPPMEAYNLSMSSVRESVEWTFGDVVKSFKALDFKSNLKIGLSSVGKMYLVCALIQNAITCLYGNQTSKFFELEPPALHDFFR